MLFIQIATHLGQTETRCCIKHWISYLILNDCISGLMTVDLWPKHVATLIKYGAVLDWLFIVLFIKNKSALGRQTSILLKLIFYLRVDNEMKVHLTSNKLTDPTSVWCGQISLILLIPVVLICYWLQQSAARHSYCPAANQQNFSVRCERTPSDTNTQKIITTHWFNTFAAC